MPPAHANPSLPPPPSRPSRLPSPPAEPQSRGCSAGSVWAILALSPSGSDASLSAIAVGRGFLPPASPVTPKTRSPISASAPHFRMPTPVSISTVGDLRNLAASTLDSLKRRLDALHGDSVCDLEASHTRISKRIKSCVQLAEEAEKEQKKMVEKITVRTDEILMVPM